VPIEPWWETNPATTPRQELGMVSPELHDGVPGTPRWCPRNSTACSEVEVEPGDLIVLFTDGIVETHSPECQLFGSERLLASVHQHRECSPDEILDALFQAVTDHAQGVEQPDDATAVILKVEATP
jgi:serine/threonine protein phosphatase PrpC